MLMAPGKLSTTATLDYEESVRDAVLGFEFNSFSDDMSTAHCKHLFLLTFEAMPVCPGELSVRPHRYEPC